MKKKTIATKLTKPKRLEKHKRETKKGASWDTAHEEINEAPPGPLLSHVNDILQTNFNDVEFHVNDHQIYNSNGLYDQKFNIFNTFEGAIYEYKGILHCKWYHHEDFPNENKDTFVRIFFHEANENVQENWWLHVLWRTGVQLFLHFWGALSKWES